MNKLSAIKSAYKNLNALKSEEEHLGMYFDSAIPKEKIKIDKRMQEIREEIEKIIKDYAIKWSVWAYREESTTPQITSSELFESELEAVDTLIKLAL